MPCLRRAPSRQRMFVSGKSKIFSWGKWRVRQRSGRAEPEVLYWCPANRPTPLIRNHNNAAVLGKGTVWFAAPWLGERIKRLSSTFIVTLSPNQKHQKILHFCCPLGGHMPLSLNSWCSWQKKSLMFSCHDLCQHGYLTVILSYPGGSFWKNKLKALSQRPQTENFYLSLA